MSTFYLGAHQPHWLWAAGFPLFVSHRQLTRRRGPLRPAACRWALDSGGFTELSMHGRWITAAEQYAEAVDRYAAQAGQLDFAASQDWMCEPAILARTGLSVCEHQERTVASYLELRALAPHLPFIPVVQGWHPADYLACVELYRSARVDLTRLPLTGLGSVCRRQSTGQIAVIVTTLAALGLRLHGFGIKTTGLHLYGHLLASADSMAWSYAARRAPGLPGCTGHRNCANRSPQLRQLPGLRHRLAGTHPHRSGGPRLPGQPVRPGIPGGGGMTAVTAWRTDEPCPVCATGLILHDDGTSPVRAECRLCGWSDTWTGDHADGGEL